MRATSRLIRGALGTTVLSLAVLLALMASRAEGPAPPHQLLAKRPVAPRPTYATQLAPRQVRVRLIALQGVTVLNAGFAAAGR